MITECLGFWGVYQEDVIKLNYTRDSAIVDLEPFFDHMFEKRDDFFGKPDFERKEPKSTGCQYNFTLEEAIQTFLGCYPIERFTSFIDGHVHPDDVQSYSFLRQLKEKNGQCRIAVPYWPGNCMVLVAKGYSGEEIDNNLPKGSLKRSDFIGSDIRYLDSFCERSARSRPIKPRDKHGYLGMPEYHQRIQTSLLRANPPILISPNHHGPGLDYFDLIRSFDEINTSGLEIVKKVVKPKATKSYDS